MVCAKCQRLLKATELATPGVKRKSEMYHGSPAGSTSTSRAAVSGRDKAQSSSTTTSSHGGGSGGGGGGGISKLLSRGAKNPYATYSSSCDKCKTRTHQGRRLCQPCAYKANGELQYILSTNLSLTLSLSRGWERGDGMFVLLKKICFLRSLMTSRSIGRSNKHAPHVEKNRRRKRPRLGIRLSRDRDSRQSDGSSRLFPFPRLGVFCSLVLFVVFQLDITGFKGERGLVRGGYHFLDVESRRRSWTVCVDGFAVVHAPRISLSRRPPGRHRVESSAP